LQRLVTAVRSLGSNPAGDPRAAEICAQLAADLGAKAVPALCRLVASEGTMARAAYEALRDAGADPVLRQRILKALSALPCPRPDAARLVAALSGELAGAELAPPADDEPPARAIFDLVELLHEAQDYARLASELCEMTNESDCVGFVADVAHNAPVSGRDLAHELLARDQFSDRAREQLRRIAGTVPPSCRVHYGSRRCGVRIGRSACGKQVIVVTRRRANRRWRVLFVVMDASGAVSAVEYSDEATRHTIDKNIIGAAVTAGYTFEKISQASGRERLVAAIRATRRAGLDIPPAYFVGRDLLGITDEHRRTEVAGVDDAALLAGALEALSSGETPRALELFESYTAAVPHDPEGFEGLGLCQLRLGNLAGARVALGRAAYLQPDEPRYHWNRAAAARSAGLRGACYLALRDYLRVAVNRDTPERVQAAEGMVAEFERKAALYYPDLSVRSAACQADLSSVKHY